DPRVRENLCSVVVMRGPLVYCAESTDNTNAVIRDLELVSEDFETDRSNLLGGVVIIKGKGLTSDPFDERGPLYRPRGFSAPLRETPIILIPYYAWANRGKSHMTVWLPFRK
ncbi:MAG: glycoside hydrolase family 127 protein, partial [Armatimonadetes bacterium]|nr:glycoside hydrolase family 127 protein [Armatimonadota bacterium]